MIKLFQNDCCSIHVRSMVKVFEECYVVESFMWKWSFVEKDFIKLILDVLEQKKVSELIMKFAFMKIIDRKCKHFLENVPI